MTGGPRRPGLGSRPYLRAEGDRRRRLWPKKIKQIELVARASGHPTRDF
jgi:hypothetical protein